MATRIAKKVGGAFPANATTTDATTRRTEKTDDNEKESFIEALASIFAQAASETAQVAQAFTPEVVETESEGANVEPKQIAEDIRSRRRLRRR